jgi:hypothetical protein
MLSSAMLRTDSQNMPPNGCAQLWLYLFSSCTTTDLAAGVGLFHSSLLATTALVVFGSSP